jgi:hypothetical protein
MSSKRIAALVLAALLGWASTGCIFLAKPAYEGVKAAVSDDDEKKTDEEEKRE